MKEQKKKGLNINFVLTVTQYSKDYSDELYEFFNPWYEFKNTCCTPSLRGNNADPWLLIRKNTENFNRLARQVSL